MKEISIVLNHMIDARCSLNRAALSLQKVKPNTFEPTIKEIKETIGDLSCSIAVLQDFFEEAGSKPENVTDDKELIEMLKDGCIEHEDRWSEANNYGADGPVDQRATYLLMQKAATRLEELAANKPRALSASDGLC